MNYVVDSSAAARFRRAWATLPPDKQAAVKPILDRAHQQLCDYVQKGRPADWRKMKRQVVLGNTALTYDKDGVVPRLPPPQASKSPELTAALAASPGIQAPVILP